MNKNIVIGVLTVLTIVFVVLFINKSITVQRIEVPIGAMPGPSFSSECVNFNGVEQCTYASALNNASTTLCSFKSPSATSTLTFASIGITTGTTTVIMVDIGKVANNTSATTTLLANSYTVATGATGNIVASSTSATTASYFTIAPSNYVNFKFGAATAITATTNSLKGNCKVIFIKN